MDSSLILRCLLAVASGVLACLSFPTYSLAPLIFVALVPLLIVLSGLGPRRGFLLGWVTGFAGHAGAFPWILPAIARFEQTSACAALPFFVLFLAYHAIQFGVFAGSLCWINQRRGEAVGPLVVASWWVLLEYGYPKLIPWSLGSTLAGSALLRQAADLAGVYGLSFLIVAVNAVIAWPIVSAVLPPFPKGGWGEFSMQR